MGVIKIIKASELNEDNGGEHIYPVTSIDAVFDRNNTKVSVLIDNIKEDQTSLNQHVMRMQNGLDDNVNSINNLESSLQDLTDDYNAYKDNINDTIESIEKPSISFVGTISGAAESVKGEQNINHNIECTTSFNSIQMCKVFDLDESKPGNAWFITKAGEYNIDNKIFNVKNLSVLQCIQTVEGEKTYEIFDLGIPFIPVPTSNDYGKTLKVAENQTLFWG